MHTDSRAVLDHFEITSKSLESLSVASVMMSSANTVDSFANSIVQSDIRGANDLQNFIMSSSASTIIPFQADNMIILRSPFTPKVLLTSFNTAVYIFCCRLIVRS